MRATEFITESQEIHNRPKLDSVLGRCIELLHDKRQANPGKYGKVAACIIDHKNRKVFGINSPGADGTRRHAERVAIDTYHKRYGKILPGAIIVTTLSPCNRDMVERDGPSCQDLLIQVGIEKVYSGYMDPSQHSDHPFTEEVTKNDELWQACKQLSDSFVHDDLSEDQDRPRAAGCILYAQDTGRYGLQQRSDNVNDPGVWAAWGGGKEPGETLEQCATRELAEESGYTGPLKLKRLAENNKYTTFIGVVPHEFEPRACSEWKDYCWVDAGDWPGPMHPGVADALQHISVNETINPDILNRRFRHTQTIGDYTYKASVEIFLDEPLLNIKAYDGAKEIGHAMFEIFHWDDAPAKSHIESGGTEVEPAYRNKGVASTMYAYAKMLGNDVRPSNMQSAQGHTMWAAWKHSGGAKHLTGQVAENFADGRNPQDKGDSKRHGVPTKASVSTLRKVAKQGGRKGQLAHWAANMKAGRAKAKKK